MVIIFFLPFSSVYISSGWKFLQSKVQLQSSYFKQKVSLISDLDKLLICADFSKSKSSSAFNPSSRFCLVNNKSDIIVFIMSYISSLVPCVLLTSKPNSFNAENEALTIALMNFFLLFNSLNI